MQLLFSEKASASKNEQVCAGVVIKSGRMRCLACFIAVSTRSRPFQSPRRMSYVDKWLLSTRARAEPLRSAANATGSCLAIR